MVLAALPEEHASQPHAPVGPPVAQKGFRAGTHRTVPPEQTLARALRFAERFGITRLADITGLDTIGIPVVVAHRPNSRSLATSQGKGLDLVAAKTSAVMESIEAFHAERISLPLKLGSYEELRGGHRLVDPDALPKSRSRTFSKSARIFWIEGRELGSDASVWVPFELVHLNYTLPPLSGSGFFLGSSNGLASGNHFLEAVSHGICEIVERDATTLWALRGANAQKQTRLALDTVDDPLVNQVLDAFERADVGVAAWETTSDTGIPSFLCQIIDRSPNPLRPLPSARGMGCHPAREVALLRALTEAAQSRLTGISGSRDDIGEVRHRRALTPEVIERARKRVCTGHGVRHFNAVPTHTATSLDEDVLWERARLASAGAKQVITVDLTEPELGFSVVRVLVPGLEGLYDMPLYVPGERAARRTAELSS